MKKSADEAAVLLETELPETLPLPFYEALDQFNSGDYFLCHETLEKLWIADKTSLREIYQGVLQIAVGCYHLTERANRVGALSKLDAGSRRLERAGVANPNSDRYPNPNSNRHANSSCDRYGVDWASLIFSADRLRAILNYQDVSLAPIFTKELLPVIQYHIPIY